MTDAKPCPSIDRHVHLEASLDPRWVMKQCRQRAIAVPDTVRMLWDGSACAFEHFIEAFLFCSSILDSAEAVQAAFSSAIARLPPRDGVCGLDVWVSPHFLVERAKLFTIDELWRAIEEAIAVARGENVQIAIVVDAVNHRGPAHGHAILDLVLSSRPPFVVGFSTGGREAVPFRDWAPVFDRARTAGLRIAAHAGESGPASNVRDAILEAGVERIIHGVRAAEDPALLELLAERRIAVDICLSSNAALVPDSNPEALLHMIRAGVRCGLGTDDPGIIPCTVPSEWSRALALGLTACEQNVLCANAVEDAWCTDVSA